MTTETVTEWYQFTCTSCSIRWVTRYKARHAIDDTGQAQPFYWYHGLPCEVPSAAVTVCPACSRTTVQAKLLDRAPADAATGQPAPVSPGHPGQPAHPHHEKTARFRPFRFAAVISLDDNGQHRPAGPYQSGTHSLMVCASSPHHPSRRYFPAVICTSGEQPLKPGDLSVTVTIVVTDDDAPEYFWAGQRFTLWDGSDIGHGTVSRQVFSWPEFARHGS